MAMVRRVPYRVAMSFALLGFILLLAGCAPADENPMTTIDPAGANNQVIYDVYSLIWWLAVAVFVLVEGLLIYVLIRFRKGPRMLHGRPIPVHGNTKLEIVWTIIPAIILVVIAIPTLQGIATLSETPGSDVQAQIEVPTMEPEQEDEELPDDPVAAGQEIVESTCASCHAVAGTDAQGTVGPELTNFASQPMIAGEIENTPENLREWLEDPQAVKPGTAMPNLNLSDVELDSLVAYLQTLE